MNTIAEIDAKVAELHIFTTDNGQIKCSCGEKVADMAATWNHTQDMRAAAALSENEKAMEEIRSTPATVVDPTTTCAHCATTIHYSGPVGHSSSSHVHTATGVRECSTEKFNLANPIPNCPKCHSVKGWEINEHAWGISSNCADCGHHTYYGIGD